MRILYVASAIDAGGGSGGATHVSEVACGLRALGHEVAVIARPDLSGEAQSRLECGVPLRTVKWRKELAMLAAPRVQRAIKAFRPQVVMERFYNFAGAGVLGAHRAGLPVLLEVNAPMIDPPGSLKSKVDRVMLGSMRRWAVQQANWSAAIVTPLATTVPPEVPRHKIHELPWGANVDRFDPHVRETRKVELAALSRELGLRCDGPVAAFLGSFRSWHGVGDFAEAARLLIERGSNLSFLAIGGGPELEPLREKVAGWNLPEGRFVFAGPQTHDRVPDYLALADIGVAPFDLAAHAPLQAFGFYWSPLKVFEYMSMALPVVTIDVAPLNEIIREGREGLLYPAGDVAALAGAMATLASADDLRQRMGAAGRERVVAHYSWRAHCVALDKILEQIADAGR
ncbi:MAG: glycosyltransferase family 4 protein [Chloroflexota bacterium]